MLWGLGSYYEWDWADGIMHALSGAAAPATDGVIHWAPGVAQASKPNARYFGLNLLSELDAPGEYHVSRATGLLHYLPAVPLESWTEDPVFSVNATAVVLAPGLAGVNISNVVVSHATSTGINGACLRAQAGTSCRVRRCGYVRVRACVPACMRAARLLLLCCCCCCCWWWRWWWWWSWCRWRPRTRCLPVPVFHPTNRPRQLIDYSVR